MTADLTHGGTGSDVEGMMSAINYVIANKNGDANRVYAAGYSSGTKENFEPPVKLMFEVVPPTALDAPPKLRSGSGFEFSV
jgi:hypothetical protein